MQLFQANNGDGSILPLHYGGYDLVWNNGPVKSKTPSTVTSYIGCNCPVSGSPNNPYRTDSHFHVKKGINETPKQPVKSTKHFDEMKKDLQENKNRFFCKHL